MDSDTGHVSIDADTSLATEPLTRTRGLELSVHDVALHVIIIPDLVDGAILTADSGLMAIVQLGEGTFDLAQVVGFRGVGGYTGVFEGLHYISILILYRGYQE